MRVLMFGWEFPPHISGGLGSACEGIVRALTQKGTDVIFVLPKLASDKGKTSNVSGLTMCSASGTRIGSSVRSVEQVCRTTKEYWKEHLRMEVVDSLLSAYATPEYYEKAYAEYLRQTAVEERRTTSSFPLQGEEVLQLHGGYGKDLMSEVYKYSLAGQAIARANDFDVIHAHDWMAYPAGILAKEATGKPLVCHVHATEVDRSGSHMNDEIAHIEWEGMQRADKVVAVSHFTKNLIMRVYQVPEEKIVVVHNAVSRKDAGHIYHAEKPKGEKQVLFMGRVTFQKGPDYFVEAARLVLQVMPNVRFLMAGAGDMLLSMVTRVAKYRIGRRFTFTGFLKGDEVERMYAASDLYVMPSVSEPFGIAPLEAMVYDVPVLMSKQSGVSEVVNNALKVDFWDVRKMADRICAVLTYPALGKFMVRNCQEELKNIRWENAANKLNAVYAELARGI